MKKILFGKLILMLLGSCLILSGDNQRKADGKSGATTLAIARNIPVGLSLKIEGKVAAGYFFDSKDLRSFATTRIRTREVSKSNEILGAYIYYGIPVYNILEGIAPEKSKEDVFDRPLDLMVEFVSSSGKKTLFSYGELTMTDDRFPVTLAYFREQLLPSKDPEKYLKNKYKGNIKGLRLICPREPDDSRYLDDVRIVTLKVLKTTDSILPPQMKGKRCKSLHLKCINNGITSEAKFGTVPVKTISNWFRIGHGRGLKNDQPVSATGYSLKHFIQLNFPEYQLDDFFMFVACDGYRSVFSGREIFCTSDGDSMLLLKTINGKKPKNGMTLGALKDFFVDRNIWGLQYIERISR